jgi:hypothetical protein
MQNMHYMGLDIHKRAIGYREKDAAGTIHVEGTTTGLHWTAG